MRAALVAAISLLLGVVGPAAALPGRYGGTLVVGLNVQVDRPIIYLEHPSTDAALSSSVTGVELNSDVQLLVAFAQYR